MTKEGPMPFYSSCRGLPRRFRLILSSFMQRDDLAFAQALPAATIEQAFGDAVFSEAEDADYTPALTLWAYLSQALSKHHKRSCRAAVARALGLLASLGNAA